MRLSKRWYVLVVLMAGCAALVWARGPELAQVDADFELMQLPMSNLRDVFPR